MPKSLSYSLRFPGELRRVDIPSVGDTIRFTWHTKELFEPNQYLPRNANEDDGGPPSYYKEGFLAIQNAITTAYIEIHQPDTVKKPTPSIFVNRFPDPPYENDSMLSTFASILPLFFILSFNYTFMNTVRFIATEKEKQLKEAMKIMGLANWLHYLSWFIRTLIMLMVSVILIAILLKVNIELTYSIYYSNCD